MGEEHGLGSSEEDDAKHGGLAQNGKIEAGKPSQFSIPQQLSQNSAIRWDRFLPIRSLKVLLVENDDSTRHVVGALLRNCSYEVTTAANGIQAWKILENMNNHVDLVLTEVVMPVLSGIGLLTKIMSHKTLKNIPVIMMSSHDSMGIVFKCLSKGAVDFLVKPIRKNELKNLWQHVWRRCHSSSGSGSGSESGTQAKNCAKSRNAENSGNDSENSHELDYDDEDDESFRDGSDNGSGTQGSWTKKEGGGALMADEGDSTCAQVIIAKPDNDENAAVGSRLVDHGRADASNGPETATNDDRNRLRYHTASSANQGLTGNVGSCSAVENSSEAIKTETGNNVASQINATLPNQQSNGSSNNDIASTAKNQKSASSSAKKSMHSSAVHPIRNGRVSCPNTKPEKTNCHVSDEHAPVQETEGTAGNYSMNGSGTGSNDVAKQPFPCLVTNENATADDKVAQREAAVIKFRQKRKERCFDKKVRHQNRKKSTEQRPRHNGQFSRQSLSANSDE